MAETLLQETFHYEIDGRLLWAKHLIRDTKGNQIAANLLYFNTDGDLISQTSYDQHDHATYRETYRYSNNKQLVSTLWIDLISGFNGEIFELPFPEGLQEGTLTKVSEKLILKEEGI